MGGYYITVKTGLLEGKHIKNMQINQKTSAIWLYLWFLDKVTKIDKEKNLGIVLGGKPFKLSDFNLAGEQATRNMLQALTKHNYIKTKRTPYGISVWITKAFKIFGAKVKESATSRTQKNDKAKNAGLDTNNNENQVPHLVSESATSNIYDKTVRQDSKTIDKSIQKPAVSAYGDPDINSCSAYFLEVMRLPKEDCTQKQSRQYWNLLIKESKTGADGVKWLIDLGAKDEFYRNNITSSKDLYYKRVKLVARKRGDIPLIAVMGGKNG